MRYRYNQYWGTWNRRLLKTSKGILEITLTPINGKDWERIKECRIRDHGTSDKERDINTDDLPIEVKEKMIEHLGDEMTTFLLYGNMVKIIGIERLRKQLRENPKNNAGLPYKEFFTN